MHKLFVLVLCAFLLVVACSDEAPPEEEILTAQELLQLSAERMQSLAGFAFAIAVEEGVAYLDAAQTLSLNAMSGNYVAPDRARAQVKAGASGFLTEIGVISIDDKTWQTNPLTGSWQELPPDFGFNPTVILDPNIGIQTILTEDTFDTAIGEPAKLTDRSGSPELQYITGTLQGDGINALSSGLIGPEDIAFEAWIAPQSHELYRVRLHEPQADGGAPVVWLIDFSAFDETVTIEPPLGP